MRILAVAHNTFREAVRDKVLYVLLFFAALTILGSKVLGWISIGQDIKIIKDISLAAISLFGVLIAIFVGASLVYKEIDKRTLYTILAQPMRRFEFVIGKYLGLAGLLAVVTLIMTGVAAGYVLVMGGGLDPVFFLAALLIYCQLLVITAFAILMSVLTSPILGAIIVFSMYLFGHATGIFQNLPPHFDDTWAKPLLESVYYLVPNLAKFDIRAEAANGIPVTPAYGLWTVAYGACWTALFLFAAALAFEDKDV